MNAPAPNGTRIFQRALYRVRGQSVRLAEEPAPERVTKPRPLRVARMLALAHHMQRLLDDRVVANQAELAELMGFTRARVTQLLDLTLLAPDIQERLLFAETTSGADPITERALRRVAGMASWVEQREEFYAGIAPAETTTPPT